MPDACSFAQVRAGYVFFAQVRAGCVFVCTGACKAHVVCASTRPFPCLLPKVCKLHVTKIKVNTVRRRETGRRPFPKAVRSKGTL